MTDKTDETGKGPSRPNEPPRRPYATIDLKATEIGRESAQPATTGGRRAEPEAAALPPPEPPRPPERLQGWLAALMRTVAAAGARVLSWTWCRLRLGTRRLVRNPAFLTHAVAGIAGAMLALAAGALLGLLPGRGGDLPADVAGRLAAVERTLAQQPSAPAGDTAAKLAAADRRLSALEAQAKAIAELRDAQSKLAAEARALAARSAAPELAQRVAKLEAGLAALSAGDKSGSGALFQRLSAKLADIDRTSGEADAAKAAAARAEQDLAALKAEAQGLRHSLEELKASVEDRVLAKMAGVEHNLQGVLKTEGERVASARRVLLALELANLKRALDRGDSYAHELEAVRKAAAGTVDLAALDRTSATGVPALGALTQDFRRVANAAIDAEHERADASVLDRLIAGARSVVHVRKAQHDASDMSVEAIVGRMEHALKEDDLGEVLAQAERLPPKAAHAAEDWLHKVEARHAADRAVAEIEAGLKASLADERVPAPVPGAEPQR
jgi:hypothetical protein